MTRPLSPPTIWKHGLRWSALLFVSMAVSLYMDSLAIPAAYMLGAIITSILFSVCKQTVVLPKPLFLTGQGVIGAMIASSIPLSIFSQIGANWPLFLVGVCSVLLLSNGIGLFMAKRHLLPGTTAIWGTSPGAATAMTLMAEEYGADVRLVALMQYLRVVMVAMAAIFVTHLASNSDTPHVPVHHVIDWSISDPIQFGLTLLLIAVGIAGGKILRLGAGPLLLTLALGLITSKIGVLDIVLPQPLLIISYALIGWNIGFRFTRESLRHALRLLPRILISTCLLIALCATLSQVLVVTLGIDPLTAYLAMSPGGADSVAIIAASGHTDMSFIMAMQTGRLILVLLSGPPIARWLASRQDQANAI